MASPYDEILRRLGLGSTEEVRQAQGNCIKTLQGRREVMVFDAADEAGRSVRLFLKRTFRAIPKDAYRTLLRHGRVWSCAREEFENLRTLRAAGIETCEPVAYGEECSALRERFSYLITAAVPARETLLEFLAGCRDLKLRRKVVGEVARVVRKMHDAGLGWPDLYGRHVYVRPELEPPGVIMIDVPRLDRKWRVGTLGRARDLGNLSLSTPAPWATRTDRLHFFRSYCGGRVSRALRWAIAVRVARLARSKKGRKLMAMRPGKMA